METLIEGTLTHDSWCKFSRTFKLQRKLHKQTAHINCKESTEGGQNAMNSAQNTTYNSTVTFTLELRSILGCKKWWLLLDLILPLHADLDLLFDNLICLVADIVRVQGRIKQVKTLFIFPFTPDLLYLTNTEKNKLKKKNVQTLRRMFTFKQLQNFLFHFKRYDVSKPSAETS